MNNELTLFGDGEIQQKTWHIGLSNELQDTLKQRAVNVQVIYLQATMAVGKELAEAQKELAYKNGGFVKWCEEEAGIDNQRAYEYIQIWEHFKMFPLSGNILTIGKKMLLAASKKSVPQSARQEIVERHESGEKITLSLSDEIIERHKAEVAAEKQRADEARKETDLAQYRLFEEQTQSKEEIAKLTAQIEAYKQEIEDLAKPEEVEVYIIPPETKDHLEKLEAKIAEITQQRDNLSKLADQLSADLDANEAKREQEARDLRIRQEWQKNADAMHKSVVKFLGQLPTPFDMQVFESDDWARLEQVMNVFKRGAGECDRLRERPALMIVDAHTVCEEAM